MKPIGAGTFHISLIMVGCSPRLPVRISNVHDTHANPLTSTFTLILQPRAAVTQLQEDRAKHRRGDKE